MATTYDIDALVARLADPDATFTAGETQALIDWYVARARAEASADARVVAAQTAAQASQDAATNAMATLLAMIDTTNTKPTLEVIE